MSAVIFGVVVGAIMNAAITYAGLKIGFTIVGSSIAAVLGFGVLRGVLRRGTILEVNIGQTIASAVNTPNSGVIFTVPVLLLLGYQFSIENRDFWLITLAGVAGAILGCAFIVPLRKQMLDIERLRFPSATAVGAILKSPGAGAKKAIVLLIGVVLSALIAIPAYIPQITRPASIESLDSLVRQERISRADMLLTRSIASWIAAQEAPDAVVEQGRLAAELIAAREANSPDARAGKSVQERRALSARVRQLEAEVQAAGVAGTAAIASGLDHSSDKALIRGYPLELAKRAYAATNGAAPWTSLRDTSAGWAAAPLPGYADLQIRMPPEPQPDLMAVDFEFSDLGITGKAQTPRVDRNRNGQPDLIVTDTTVDVGRWLGLPDEAQLLFAIAPFALGAGYLTGRAGLFVLAGGVLAYLVINPVMFAMGWMPATIRADGAPAWGYGNINRPLGIGLLLGGALMGMLASAPAIKEAFKSIAATGSRGAGGKSRDELGLGVLSVAACGALVLLFVAADITGSEPINTKCPVTEQRIDSFDHTIERNGYVIAFADAEALTEFEAQPAPAQEAALKSMNATRPGLLADLHPHVRAAIIALVGALWIWFAGIIIAQCTGMTDWSPISGMALLTVVLVMLLGGPGEVIGAVLIGVALCVAITCASDMMADLKTGYIVGAQPKRQQIVEMLTAGIGPVIAMLVLLVIAASNMKKFGAPIGPGTDTPAPQAQALQAIITGVQGGAMPYALYGFGAILGALLGLGAFSGLGVLVGLSMYLPMHYIATYGIGCILNMIVSRIKGPRWAEEWGVPMAAGFIVGDALLSLGVNSIVLVMS
jgi:uncharacterized oligopeptide transporter (OPT) family protein